MKVMFIFQHINFIVYKKVFEYGVAGCRVYTKFHCMRLSGLSVYNFYIFKKTLFIKLLRKALWIYCVPQYFSMGPVLAVYKNSKPDFMGSAKQGLSFPIQLYLQLQNLQIDIYRNFIDRQKNCRRNFLGLGKVGFVVSHLFLCVFVILSHFSTALRILLETVQIFCQHLFLVKEVANFDKVFKFLFCMFVVLSICRFVTFFDSSSNSSCVLRLNCSNFSPTFIFSKGSSKF